MDVTSSGEGRRVSLPPPVTANHQTISRHGITSPGRYFQILRSMRLTIIPDEISFTSVHQASMRNRKGTLRWHLRPRQQAVL